MNAIRNPAVIPILSPPLSPTGHSGTRRRIRVGASEQENDDNVVIFQYLMLAAFGVPRLAWRYIGLADMKPILGALGAATAVLVGLRLGMVHIGGYAMYVVIPLGVLAIDFVLAWSDWRRRHQARAQAAHYRRPLARAPT